MIAAGAPLVETLNKTFFFFDYFYFLSLDKIPKIKIILSYFSIFLI